MQRLGPLTQHAATAIATELARMQVIAHVQQEGGYWYVYVDRQAKAA